MKKLVVFALMAIGANVHAADLNEKAHLATLASGLREIYKKCALEIDLDISQLPGHPSTENAKQVVGKAIICHAQGNVQGYRQLLGPKSSDSFIAGWSYNLLLKWGDMMDTLADPFDMSAAERAVNNFDAAVERMRAGVSDPIKPPAPPPPPDRGNFEQSNVTYPVYDSAAYCTREASNAANKAAATESCRRRERIAAAWIAIHATDSALNACRSGNSDVGVSYQGLQECLRGRSA
jgi:hypothetical protein